MIYARDACDAIEEGEVFLLWEELFRERGTDVKGREPVSDIVWGAQVCGAIQVARYSYKPTLRLSPEAPFLDHGLTIGPGGDDGEAV